MNINEILAKMDELYAGGDISAIEDYLTRNIRLAKEEQSYAALLSLYNEISGFYRNTGNPHAAAEYSEEALKLITKLDIEDSLYHGITLLNGATAYCAAGDYQMALSWYKQSEEVLARCDEGGAAYTKASLYNNMSNLYEDRGESDKALEYLTKAMDIIKTLPDSEPEVATTHVNIAYAMMSTGAEEDAKQHIDEALGYYESEAGRKDIHYGSALACVAEYLYRSGHIAEAAAKYEEAAAEVKRCLGENSAYRSHMANAGRLREEL